MNLLIVNAHPAPDNAQSATQQMLAHLRGKLPADTQILKLYAQDIPELDATTLSAMYKLINGITGLTHAEQQSMAQRTAILEQFLAATRIIIALPMYNFGIPARLKAWIDNLVVPDITFRYDADGKPVGLLSGRKLWILQASGSAYSAGYLLAAMEYSIPYLRTVFAFIGISDCTAIRAEGTMSADIGMAQAVAQACAAIDQQWPQFMQK